MKNNRFDLKTYDRIREMLVEYRNKRRYMVVPSSLEYDFWYDGFFTGFDEALTELDSIIRGENHNDDQGNV